MTVPYYSPSSLLDMFLNNQGIDDFSSRGFRNPFWKKKESVDVKDSNSGLKFPTNSDVVVTTVSGLKAEHSLPPTSWISHWFTFGSRISACSVSGNELQREAEIKGSYILRALWSSHRCPHPFPNYFLGSLDDAKEEGEAHKWRVQWLTQYMEGLVPNEKHPVLRITDWGPTGQLIQTSELPEGRKGRVRRRRRRARKVMGKEVRRDHYTHKTWLGPLHVSNQVLWALIGGMLENKPHGKKINK